MRMRSANKNHTGSWACGMLITFLRYSKDISMERCSAQGMYPGEKMSSLPNKALTSAADVYKFLSLTLLSAALLFYSLTDWGFSEQLPHGKRSSNSTVHYLVWINNGVMKCLSVVNAGFKVRSIREFPIHIYYGVLFMPIF